MVTNKEVLSLFFLLVCVFAWLDRSPFGAGVAISAMPATLRRHPHTLMIYRPPTVVPLPSNSSLLMAFTLTRVTMIWRLFLSDVKMGKPTAGVG